MGNAADKPRRKRRTREEIEAGELEVFKNNSKGYYAQNYPPEYYTCIEHAPNKLHRHRLCELNAEYVNDHVTQVFEIGMEEYIWRTAGDSRVCPRCASYHGKKFRYDTMPPGGHPGLAAGCRCVALTVLDNKKCAMFPRRT